MSFLFWFATVLVIQCSSEYIDCASSSCEGASNVTCTSGPCIIDCQAEDACRETTLYCYDGADCNIITSTHASGVRLSTIYCPDNANCIFNGTADRNTYRESIIHCGINGACYFLITQGDNNYHLFSLFNATYSNYLQINKFGPVTQSVTSNIYCPITSNNFLSSSTSITCHLNCGSDTSSCDNLAIYTSYGFNDIIITNNVTSPDFTNSVIYCFDDSTSCNINSNSNNPNKCASNETTCNILYSQAPTYIPTVVPTSIPSQPPTNHPTDMPSSAPTNSPSQPPTNAPSDSPSAVPSNAPTFVPTGVPSQPPSRYPSQSPSQPPSNAPTYSPSSAPSFSPSVVPSNAPSISPSNSPTQPPTSSPTSAPTEEIISGNIYVFYEHEVEDILSLSLLTYSEALVNATMTALMEVLNDTSWERMCEQFNYSTGDDVDGGADGNNCHLTNFNPFIDDGSIGRIGTRRRNMLNSKYSYNYSESDSGASGWWQGRMENLFYCVVLTIEWSPNECEDFDFEIVENTEVYAIDSENTQYAYATFDIVADENAQNFWNYIQAKLQSDANDNDNNNNNTNTNTDDTTTDDFNSTDPVLWMNDTAYNGTTASTTQFTYTTTSTDGSGSGDSTTAVFETTGPPAVSSGNSESLEIFLNTLNRVMQDNYGYTNFKALSISLSTTVITYDPDSKDTFAERAIQFTYGLYAFMGFCCILAVLAKVHANKSGADNVRIMGIIFFGVWSWDFFSDVLFAARMYDQKYYVHFAFALVFVAIPYFLQFYQVLKMQQVWVQDTSISRK